MRSLRGLCRTAARVPQLKLWPGRAPAAKPPAQDVAGQGVIAPVCRRLRSSPYAHLRRDHTPLLLPRFTSGCAAHAAARPMVTATVATGLGFSVASLPQCRRGRVLVLFGAVRRLPQGRCAACWCATAKALAFGMAFMTMIVSKASKNDVDHINI